jgi:hypothetical protein
MPETFTVKVGDWVRFQRGGALVIGVVSYLMHDMCGYATVVTDLGPVPQKDILEVRPALKEVTVNLDGAQIARAAIDTRTHADVKNAPVVSDTARITVSELRTSWREY